MKLKYILPVATIASVASVVAPLAVSCSHSGGDVGETITINLTKRYYYIEPEENDSGRCYLKSENDFNPSQNNEYIFNIDLKDYDWESAITDPQQIGSFAVIVGEFDPDEMQMVDFLSAEIWIDNVPLTFKDGSIGSIDNNMYSFRKDEGLYYKFSDITAESKIKIKAKLKDSTNSCCPMYVPSILS